MIGFLRLLIDRRGFGELAFNPLQMWMDVFLQSGMKFRIVFQTHLFWSVNGTILNSNRFDCGIKECENQRDGLLI